MKCICQLKSTYRVNACVSLEAMRKRSGWHTVAVGFAFLPVSLNDVLTKELSNGVRVFDSLRRFGVRGNKCALLDEVAPDLGLGCQKDRCVA